MSHEIEVTVRAPAAGGKLTIARIITDAINRAGLAVELQDEDLPQGFDSTVATAERIGHLNQTGTTVKVTTKQTPRPGHVGPICLRDDERTTYLLPAHIKSLSRLPATNACVTRAHPARTLLITNEDEHMTFVNSEAEFAAAVEVWSLWLASRCDR